MSTTTIVIIVAVVALIAVFAVRGSGPRVTQIDRTVRKEKDSDDA
jgi:multisubunit Na+/H+ antiporter MnhC subunit